jgi:hypothetical protein
MNQQTFAGHRSLWAVPFLFVLFLAAASVRTETLYCVNTANQLLRFN